MATRRITLEDRQVPLVVNSIGSPHSTQGVPETLMLSTITNKSIQQREKRTTIILGATARTIPTRAYQSQSLERWI
jgi:hypothetical protein